MKSKALLIASTAILMLGISVNSAQAAFEWLSSPALGHKIEIKYRNFENLVGTVGDDLFGLGYVTDIFDTTDAVPLWNYLTAGQGNLTVIFKDYLVADIQGSGNDTKVFFTGGLLNFYYTDSNAASGIPDPVQGTNADPDGANNAFDTGSLWLSLAGTSGAFLDDPATAFDESSATLGATLNGLTGFQNGDGLGLFDVIGGSQAFVFDNNPGFLFNPTADLVLSTDLDDQSSSVPDGSYPVRSNDPLQAVGVPAPGGLVALLGMWATASLLGWFKRRK